MPHTPAEASTIRVCGAFSAKTASGGNVAVTHVEIAAEDYCCDVHVVVAESPEGDACLAEDAAFLADVNAALAQAGYAGPALGRAELGAQQDQCIVLESTVAFQRWAMSLGWRYAEGSDAFEAGLLMRTVPSNSHVTFKTSDGAVQGVPLWWVVERHAESVAPQCGGMAATLRERVLPELKADPQVAQAWLRALDWADIEPMVRVVKPAPRCALREEFRGASLRVTGAGAQQWREEAS